MELTLEMLIITTNRKSRWDLKTAPLGVNCL
jgi:hypothetical protein